MVRDIDEMIEEQEQAWEEAMEQNEELGEGLVEGKVVTFPVADGKAAYEVVEIGEKVSIVKYRDDLVLDQYRSDAVDHSTGEILTSVLRQRIEQEEAMRDIFN